MSLKPGAGSAADAATAASSSPCQELSAPGKGARRTGTLERARRGRERGDEGGRGGSGTARGRSGRES